MTLPKMKDVFVESVVDSDEFRNWFRDSKVVGSDGKPQIVFHSTDAKNDFQSFREMGDEIGFHFGTDKAAEDRLESAIDNYGYKNAIDDTGTPYAPGSRMFPVYLSIQNPVKLQDLGSWDAEDIGKSLLQLDKITKEEYESMAMRDSRTRKNDELKKLLKKHGVDGFTYVNKIEDAGSTSWIALYPNQVKSIYNKGTWDPKKTDIREDQ